MPYFRLNQILTEDDAQTIVCRTRLRDRLIAGVFFVSMSCFLLVFALITLPVCLPVLPPYYSVNSWPLFLSGTCICVPILWWLLNLSYTLRLSLLHRTYRMTRGFFPLVLISCGPFEDVNNIFVLRLYQTGSFVSGARVCTYLIQLEWKKMQWLHRSMVAMGIGWIQESAVTLGITESLAEAEEKAQEFAAKIGVPYNGMQYPLWMPKGNRGS